ncbi:MAG: class I SAM-dependent methyltransferase [Roseivirga sp.]|nr:class I SAM-dependent methyltransferase [Roseivirga sp.]
MLLNKVRKHAIILQRRLKQESQLKRLYTHKNPTLDRVLDAFNQVKANQYEEDDHKSFARCEEYRQRLSADQSLISYEIFGLDMQKKVSESVKASSTTKWCQFLYNLSKHPGTKNVLEIGTNLGVSGSYILEGLSSEQDGYFVTMEGLPKSCEIANDNFKSIASEDRFQVIQGLYDETFPKLMSDNILFDMAFIDGNHQKDPTLHYFQQLKTRTRGPVIFIFDDINWSQGMKEAWAIIKADKDVNYTIDMWRWGIVVIDDASKDKNCSSSLHLAF